MQKKWYEEEYIKKIQKYIVKCTGTPQYEGTGVSFGEKIWWGYFSKKIHQNNRFSFRENTKLIQVGVIFNWQNIRGEYSLEKIGAKTTFSFRENSEQNTRGVVF